MKTTMRRILSYYPCGENTDKFGWGLLKKNIEFNGDLDTEVTMLEILESNGIKEAIWFLRAFDIKDCLLFIADAVEINLQAHEEYYPNDSRLRLAIEGIRKYHDGRITIRELGKLGANAKICYKENKTAAACSVADAVTFAIDKSDYSCHSYYAVSAAGYAETTVERAQNWNKIEKFLRKYNQKPSIDLP